MAKHTLIGIAGAFGSGKSTAATILKSYGFQTVSLVEPLEEELTKRGEIPLIRTKLQDLGNEWRVQYGNAILMEKALEKVREQNWEKVVIEGYRNSSEIKRFRQEENTLLISLVVNRAIRFERLQQVKRREELTREVFDRLDDRDLGINEGQSGLQTAICIALADIFIENNGTVEQLTDKLKTMLTTYAN